MGPNTKVKDKQCEVNNTTQQLLADLTDDFEEAITAQICLSNQLLDANIETVESVKEDILILKSDSSAIEQNRLSMEETNIKTNPTTATIAFDSGVETETATVSDAQKQEQTAVNSVTDDEIAVVSDEIGSQEPSVNKIDERDKIEVDDVSAAAEKSTTAEPTITAKVKKDSDISFKEETTDILKKGIAKPISAITSTSSKQNNARPPITTLEELPPIRTDSTMTASEVEDNIEERLSQLDGTPVNQSTSEETVGSATPNFNDILEERAQTPTSLATTHVEELQQELQQTPTPPSQNPHHQQQQQQQQQHQHNTSTPQSSSSSVNTMGSAGIHITKDFMKEASAGELEDQDIEEVLKALKGLDSSAAADTICDLNVLFNEVYTTLNYEEINSQHNSSGCGSKPVNPLREMQVEIEKKQQIMQRKIEFLLRRLRKMQARYMCKHTSEEISGLFEWAARTVSKVAKISDDDDVTERQQLNTADQKSHPVTAIQLSTMLRKIEMVANAQQLTTASSSTAWNNIGKKKTTKKLTAATASSLQEASGNENKPLIVTVVPVFDKKVTEEIGHVSGLLQSEMHEIQLAIDSDATESSSGGESADEMVTYNNQLQQSLQISKRAAWRYSRDRAAIASRWSWLLSQISDLEIKIRQHSELHQELLNSKGPTIIDRTLSSNSFPPSGTETTSTTIANSTQFNGYKATQSLPSLDSGKSLENNCSTAEEFSCCRTRGILASNFRKRKLFQTANIHTFSKKAARPSTIKCGCQWPLLPCALCTGRTDPTAPRDLPDTMMMADRVALLDPGFHPVLSFPGDISNSIHFEAICRLPDWQQRVLRCPVKNIAKNVWRAERDALHASMGKRNSDSTKRKYIKKKDLYREQQQQQHQHLQGNNGNGTGTLSMSSTPLVANRTGSNSQDMTMNTVQQPNNRINNLHHNHNSNNSHHRASDYHQTNYAQYNPSQTHSSSISSTIKNSKNRKLSSSATALNSTIHYNHHTSDYNNCSNSELNYLHSDSWDSQITRSRTSSPTQSGSKKNKSFDRRNRISYDIDNIVIPYSVAAATRVELLPYKEIPTPKWRIVDEDTDELPPASSKPEGPVTSSNQNGEAKLKSEDISSPNVDCNRENAASDGNISVSAQQLNVESPEQNQALPINDEAVKSNLNHLAEAAPISKSAKEVTVDSNSSANNKCRSTTKRTYSEKENSVDTIDEFDTIKDNNKKTSQSFPSSKVSESSNEPNKKKSEPTENNQKQHHQDTNDLARVSTAKTIKCNNQKLSDYVKSQEIGVNNIIMDLDEVGEEDITDEAMILRHERALIEERQRLKFPWSTRSRANRRIDSRVDWSSDANTPDPASPATNTPSLGGGDLDSIPSPVAPSTPLNSVDGTIEGNETTSILGSALLNNGSIAAPPPPSWPNSHNKRNERRRTTSGKNNKEQERRSLSPDQKDFFSPYEPRKFPIPTDIFENIIKIDNIVNAISSKKHKRRVIWGCKSETPASKKVNNLKSNATHLSGVSTIHRHQREFGNAYDDSSDFRLNGVESYAQNHLNASTTNDEAYQPYETVPHHRRRNRLFNDDDDDDMIGSDFVSSEVEEPFSDDDPNDPEWKGETDDKDKIRRRI